MLLLLVLATHFQYMKYLFRIRDFFDLKAIQVISVIF